MIAFILVGRQRKLSVYNRVYKYALAFGKFFDALYKVYYTSSLKPVSSQENRPVSLYIR